jgi:hypothetical protein
MAESESSGDKIARLTRERDEAYDSLRAIHRLLDAYGVPSQDMEMDGNVMFIAEFPVVERVRLMYYLLGGGLDIVGDRVRKIHAEVSETRDGLVCDTCGHKPLLIHLVGDDARGSAIPGKSMCQWTNAALKDDPKAGGRCHGTLVEAKRDGGREEHTTGD